MLTCCIFVGGCGLQQRTDGEHPQDDRNGKTIREASGKCTGGRTAYAHRTRATHARTRSHTQQGGARGRGEAGWLKGKRERELRHVFVRLYGSRRCGATCLHS